MLIRFSDVVDLLKMASPFFGTIPKARTAKIVRTIIDIVSKVPDSLALQDTLCRQVIAWCRAEKRNFLRQRIQSRQAGLVSYRLRRFDSFMPASACRRSQSNSASDALRPGEFRPLEYICVMWNVSMFARVMSGLEQLDRNLIC